MSPAGFWPDWWPDWFGQSYREPQRPVQSPYERAEALFMSRLTERQRADYRKSRKIVVRGNRRGIYELRCSGYSGNVRRLRAERRGWLRRKTGRYRYGFRLCAYPCGASSLPEPDVWLAQLLAIRCQEWKFRAIGGLFGVEAVIMIAVILVITGISIWASV